ncbi:MAG TPA: glycine--tRNA ligase subunit beta [Candidatus Dojkabacteria bacterium]|nr:glycine--tRNA ligase subunit beta [Candidatus Dojkabacteria bacterium]
MDFLIEYGVEEIPAREAQSIYKQLKGDLVNSVLDKNGLSIKEYETYITPRRIALILKDIDIKSTEKNIIGPPASKAFTGSRINEIGRSFAEKNDTSIRKLRKISINNEVFLCIPRDVKSATGSKLEHFCLDLIKKVQTNKQMSWDETKVSFIRPIRWITTVLDTIPISIEIGTASSSTLSYGSRTSGTTKIRIKNPSEYVSTLKSFNVIVSNEERINNIKQQIQKIEEENNVKIKFSSKQLQYMSYMVETPLVIIGNYNESFLKMPKEIITEVLWHHLKSFTVFKNGKIQPNFVSIAEQIPENRDSVKQGWEEVVNVRLSDGLFYYERDQKHTIEEFSQNIKNITIHEKVGNLFELRELFSKLLPKVASLTKISQQQLQLINKVSNYLFFDRGTNLVTEFPALEYTVGTIYAKERNVENEIVELLSNIHRPVNEMDIVPTDILSFNLALTHKLTFIKKYIEAGFRIKGSYDPFGIRRLISGIIRLLIESKSDITISNIIDIIKLDKENANYLIELISNKLENNWKKKNITENYINNAINYINDQPLAVVSQELQIVQNLDKANEKWFADLTESLKRIRNILKKSPCTPKDQYSKFKVKQTDELYKSILALTKELSKVQDIEKYLKKLSSISKQLNKYFDDVMIMDKDTETAKQNCYVLSKLLEVSKYL